MKNVTKGNFDIRRGMNLTVGTESTRSGRLHDVLVCMLIADPDANQDAETAKANAMFICDAFNVHNETGLSPVELKDRMYEFGAILEGLLIEDSVNDEWKNRIKFALKNSYKTETEAQR